MKMNKFTAFLTFLFMVVLGANLFAGGSQSKQAAPGTAAKKNIKFYGKIVEYTSGEAMTNKLTEIMAGKYNIEALQVDWGNLDTVIRTGIGGGEPCDVYQYWPQNMRALIDAGMALDLTPYLEANGGAWKKTFISSALNTGFFDGKYWAVPVDSNYSVMLGNKKLLEDNGITIPNEWNWDQLLAFCAQIKAKGLYPLASAVDNSRADWFFRNAILSLSASEGKLEQMAKAQVPASDPIFEKAFTGVKTLYDRDYMYPGAGAVTITVDEAKAAFFQGRVALMAEIAAGAGPTVSSAPFEVVIIPWPKMGTTNAVLGGCDGLFIPANVADKEAAVEVLKAYTSATVQQISADHGYPAASAEVTVSNPITKLIIEYSASVYPFEFSSSNAKLSDYFANELLAEVVLGGGPAAAQASIARLMQ
jgi:ABC-type glycerol-3-phosphate transport system substrate-binding protein